MKNILIAGVAKSGKSLFCKKLTEKEKYNIKFIDTSFDLNKKINELLNEISWLIKKENVYEKRKKRRFKN